MNARLQPAVADLPRDRRLGETDAPYLAPVPNRGKTCEPAFVADTAACEDVKVDPGFVLLVSAQAIDADQDAPLPDLAEEQC